VTLSTRRVQPLPPASDAMDATLSKQIIETFRKNGNIVDEKLVPECKLFFNAGFNLMFGTGVKLCNTFSLTAEDLLWKVEANNYSARNNMSEFTPVTMDTLGAIKKQLSQVQTKGTRTQMKSRQNQQAEVNLRSAPSTLKAATAVKKEEPSSQRFLEVGSPSVSLIGPDMDREAKKKRACGLFLRTDPITLIHFQIGTCMKSSSIGVKVCEAMRIIDVSFHIYLSHSA